MRERRLLTGRLLGTVSQRKCDGCASEVKFLTTVFTFWRRTSSDAVVCCIRSSSLPQGVSVV